jgi:chaperonin GroEL
MSKLEVHLENPIVFVYDGKIKGLKGLIHLMEYSNQQNRPLLIISNGIEGDALQALIMNKANGILDVAAVNSPGHGSMKVDQLKDIATVLGSSVLSEAQGHDIANINPESIPTIIGSAERIQISSTETTIINGIGEKEAISNRVDEIQSQIDNQEDESEVFLLKERLAKLEGGVAILRIGAYTDVELKEKKDRVEDALAATKAAVEEGILPGGGIALYRASEDIGKSDLSELVNEGEKMGFDILLGACKDPFNTIISNSGENPEVVAKDLTDEYTNGYDSRNGKYVDMIQEGIIDPAKVTRSAIENAASVSSLMITTECVLIEEVEAKESA